MSALTDIGTYIAAQHSLTLGTDLFHGQMPDSPDTCVAIHVRPGLPPDFSMGADPGVAHMPNYDRVKFQVKVRRAVGDTDYADGETLIWAIHRTLSIVEVTLSGTRWISIEPQDSPSLLEEDKKGRLVFVANFFGQRVAS